MVLLRPYTLLDNQHHICGMGSVPAPHRDPLWLTRRLITILHQHSPLDFTIHITEGCVASVIACSLMVCINAFQFVWLIKVSVRNDYDFPSFLATTSFNAITIFAASSFACVEFKSIRDNRFEYRVIIFFVRGPTELYTRWAAALTR